MSTNEEKLKKLQNKIEEFKKELADLEATYEFVMDLTEGEYTPPHCMHFFFSFERSLKTIKKIMKK